MFNVNFLAPAGIQDSDHDEIKNFHQKIPKSKDKDNADIVTVETNNKQNQNSIKINKWRDSYNKSFANVFLPLVLFAVLLIGFFYLNQYVFVYDNQKNIKQTLLNIYHNKINQLYSLKSDKSSIDIIFSSNKQNEIMALKEQLPYSDNYFYNIDEKYFLKLSFRKSYYEQLDPFSDIVSMLENKVSDIEINMIDNNFCELKYSFNLEQMQFFLIEIIDNNLFNKLYFEIIKTNHDNFSMLIQTNCE